MIPAEMDHPIQIQRADNRAHPVRKLRHKVKHLLPQRRLRIREARLP